jgi:hypothetical protein
MDLRAPANFAGALLFIKMCVSAFGTVLAIDDIKYK